MSKNPRYTLPVDAIFTCAPDNPLAFMAHRLGYKIGVNSDMGGLYGDIAKSERWNWHHKLMFIDCAFKNYNHEKHLKALEAHKPKYATVRDIMTREQCADMDIEYFDFDTIMRFVEEIEQLAESVIVIPKFDCLRDIPAKHIIGKPMSSYGKFSLDMSLLAGRRVHLLGGSWKKQRELIIKHKEQIVSFDNNNLWKRSLYGSFDMSSGKYGDLSRLGLIGTSPQYASVVLSLCHIARGLHDIYGTGGYEQQEQSDVQLLNQGQMFLSNDKIVIVPCGAKKLDRSAKAREMYTGNYHRACLKYALSIAIPDNVFILSAKYGLLALYDWIEPYDLRIGKNGSVTVEEIEQQVMDRDLRHKTIIALGGKDYTKIIKEAHRGTVITPLSGGMFEQIRWLKKNKGVIPNEAK